LSKHFANLNAQVNESDTDSQVSFIENDDDYDNAYAR